MSGLYLSNPCAFFRYFRTRRCGRSQRPAFPAPSVRERDDEIAELGRKSRRENEHVCRSSHPVVMARLDRATQYSRDSRDEPMGRGVLDAPHARGMTAVCGATIWQNGAQAPDLRCAMRIGEPRDSGLVLRTPRNDANASPRRPLGLDLPLRHDAIAAALLGLVERAVAAIDQIFHGLAKMELADADRHGRAGQLLAGGAACDLALGERPAEALGDRRADV